MSDKEKNPKIGDLAETPLSDEEQSSVKGGLRLPGGGIKGPGATLPIMTSDSSGMEQVDGT